MRQRRYSPHPPACQTHPGSIDAPSSPQAPPRRTAHTRISGMRTALIAGVALLIVVLIFIIQNAHAVKTGTTSRLRGADGRSPMAVTAMQQVAVQGQPRIEIYHDS
jgi:uncharacterized integral membrane protein